MAKKVPPAPQRRKVPGTPPVEPPCVAPAEESGEASVSLKLSGTGPDPSQVDEVEPPKAPTGIVPGVNPASQTPEAKAKRRQSLQISHSVRRLLSMTPQQFQVAMAAPETVADQIAVNLVVSAATGVMDAIKTVYERTEGRVPQALDINSNNTHREVHERVSDIARDRANAAAIAAAGSVSSDQEVLDLSTDGDDRSEGNERKPGVAGEAS